MLYHPCADRREVDLLRQVVTSCLRRHVITPSRQLSRHQVRLISSTSLTDRRAFISRASLLWICPSEVQFYFVPSMGAKFCNQRVCMSVCPLAYLRKHTFKFHLIFCAFYVWPCLGPPLTAMYVIYFRFGG